MPSTELATVFNSALRAENRLVAATFAFYAPCMSGWKCSSDMPKHKNIVFSVLAAIVLAATASQAPSFAIRPDGGKLSRLIKPGAHLLAPSSESSPERVRPIQKQLLMGSPASRHSNCHYAHGVLDATSIAILLPTCMLGLMIVLSRLAHRSRQRKLRLLGCGGKLHRELVREFSDQVGAVA